MKNFILTLLFLSSLFTFSSSYSQVTQEWVQRYNGTDNGLDIAFSVAVDYAGNVIVCGTSPGTGSGNDITIVKYNSEGTQVWVSRYNGTSNGSDGINGTNAVAVDISGNIYVTGWSESVDGYMDIVTLKYDAGGDQQWEHRYSGQGANYDAPMGIKLDASANVYVAGRSDDPVNGGDYFLIKYNSDGVFQWWQMYDGNGHSYDCANAVTTDNDGNVYITGYSSGSSSGECITIKYNSDGIQQWTALYNGPAGGGDYGNAIITDNDGNVYVAGGTFNNDTFNDFLVIKYDALGQQQWVNTYSSVGGNTDEVRSIGIDGSGNIYVTGVLAYSEGGSTDNFGTVKYSSSGTELWDQIYNGTAGTSDEPFSIAVDNDGNSYVTGYSHFAASAEDMTIVKYNTNGVQQWIQSYDGPSSAPDVGYDVLVDAAGNVYAAGCSFDTQSSMDYVVIMYSQIIPVEFISFGASVSGNNVVLNWSTATETNNKGFEVQRSEVRDQRSDWKMIGFVGGFGTTTDPKSYSFKDNDVNSGNYSYRLKQIDFDGTFNYSNAIEVSINTPLKFSLNQNYPNPFNPTTKINYSVPKDGKIQISIYNLLGQKVTELINGWVKAGTYNVDFNASQLTSGVYFCRMEAYNFSAIMKMILLR